MNDKLPLYPATKHSGIDWLGRIPQHWEVVRAKNLFLPVDVRSKRGNEELLTVSSERGVIRRSSGVVTMFKAESYIGYKLCWPGDLVINSLWAWGRGLGVSQHHGIVSSAYGVYRLRPKFADYSDFMHELVRSKPFQWELQVRSKGIWISRLQLTDEAFLTAPLPVPPPADKVAIVRFLHHLDHQTRRYIRAKQNLVALFEEQKEAIIYGALTSGLDSDLRLKPSGLAWLTAVPNHWEIYQIGHFARVGNGSTPSRSHESYWSDGHFPWLNSSCANHEEVTEADQFVTDAALRDCHLPIVRPPSVLIAITGQGKTRGKATILRIPATINQHLAFITPRTTIASVEFLQTVLRAAYNNLRAISDDSGSTKGALTCADLGHFRVPVPPRAEQEAILQRIEVECRLADSAIRSAKSEIAALREYQVRLASDVVTGKVDVRQAVADLPNYERAVTADDPNPTEANIGGDEAELVGAEMIE